MSDNRAPVASARFGLIARITVTVVAIGIWFWTQSLIGARTLPSSGINDGLQNLFAGLNAYLNHSSSAANALLIISSGLIDLLGLFLVSKWIFLGTVRPFLGLAILLALRQLMQVVCALPAPPNAIWHYPGFPSLFVTYNVANDYFFSGHTAIAVFAATELTRLRRKWLTALTIVVVFFEIAAVLILRAHYTMDVFTGAVAALWISSLCDSVALSLTKREA